MPDNINAPPKMMGLHIACLQAEDSDDTITARPERIDLSQTDAYRPISADAGPGQVRDSAGALAAIPRYRMAKRQTRLPVLEAFQNFLEAERRKNQRRIIMLSTFFSLLLISLIGASVVAWLGFTRTVNARMHDLKTQLDASRIETDKIRRDASVAISDIETGAREIIRQALSAGKKTGTDQPPEPQPGLVTEMDRISMELNELRGIVAKFENQSPITGASRENGEPALQQTPMESATPPTPSLASQPQAETPVKDMPEKTTGALISMTRPTPSGMAIFLKLEKYPEQEIELRIPIPE